MSLSLHPLYLWSNRTAFNTHTKYATLAHTSYAPPLNLFSFSASKWQSFFDKLTKSATLEVIVSKRGGFTMNMFLTRMLGLKVPASVCGHQTKLKDRVSAFGESRGYRLIPHQGKVEYCHQCLAKMTIRCAWCGKPIFIGSPITLYSPSKPKEFAVPEYAVVYDANRLVLVGCLRWECAETGADRMGFWVPPGVVERVLSPLELCAMTGQVVINNNLGNPGEPNQLIRP